MRATRGVEDFFKVVLRLLAQPVNSNDEANTNVIAKKNFTTLKVFFMTLENEQDASS